MNYTRERLGAKLFLAHLMVILIGVIILGITIQITIPAAFNRHMGMTLAPGASADEIAPLSTSFNQMAAQLEQVESMRRQLIGDVTHALRTPLTSVKGHMEGLVDGVLPATPDTFDFFFLQS